MTGPLPTPGPADSPVPSVDPGPLPTPGLVAAQVDPGLTRLHRLDRDDPRTRRLRAAVVTLRPLPGQEQYSGYAKVTLPEADAAPTRTPFAVVHEEDAVGFGVLDTGGYLPDLTSDPARAVLLRAFYIGADHQLRGHGRRAAALLPAFVHDVHPGAEVLYLTVNEANPAAIRAYAAGGFTDVGRYLGGSLGPQRVMTTAVALAS
ncbi:GNAT family N-acetyltransferase [Georgenia sp. TF02-10]|uniref:GNAT family N-acetyltransferase n=1 Tax=Georgenia sp. TF02-10 TaxID=2917725 RepID=UPI001FA7CD8D|nr:GNAT family protein [Georgenia sp. TF02-10]UNX53620.1 GNAT family N-acetyltransferase [Georgenia sp. TF02-10]